MRSLLVAALAASCLFAHHSTAIYDLVHGTIIVGEVRRFEWENPHAHIYLDVDGENGEVEHWLVEMESPALLGCFGWKKDTLKPGDQITVTGGRAKDNSFRIRAASILLPDGRKLPALPPVDN
ncbi:MAG TPA: DUF6152 family protein [Bryobacteraceae bacterium]